MMRHCVVLAAVICLYLTAHQASAAIVTLSVPATAIPGETIFVTARGSTGVGPADVPSTFVWGNVLYQDAYLDTNTAFTSQYLIPGMDTLGAMSCTTAKCHMLSQIVTVGAPAVLPDLSDFLLSKVSFIVDPATPVGTVLDFNWQTTPSSQSLDFFGAEIGPGVSMTIVPEPATAALLTVGLLGLAVRRKASLRRS